MDTSRSESMTESIICYSPELILRLDKEEKDYPIDPMVLAVLNGIKKTGPPQFHGPHGSHGSQGSHGSHGMVGRGRSFANNSRFNNTNWTQGSQGPQGPNRPLGSHNSSHRGSKGNRNRLQSNIPRRKLYVEEGDAFTNNIKSCLAKLSSENFAQINSQLLSYEMDKPDTIDEIARLLHEAAINGVFIVDYYVALFLSLAKKFPKLVVPLSQRILSQINEPKNFSDDEDTLTETIQQKSDRWQMSNIQIFAELYKKGVYKEELLRKILRTFLERASLENTITLKLIVELMQKIRKQYDVKRRDHDMNDILKKLEEIGKDKKYPGIIRFPLLNCVKEFDESTKL